MPPIEALSIHLERNKTSLDFCRSYSHYIAWSMNIKAFYQNVWTCSAKDLKPPLHRKDGSADNAMHLASAQENSTSLCFLMHGDMRRSARLMQEVANALARSALRKKVQIASGDRRHEVRCSPPAGSRQCPCAGAA